MNGGDNMECVRVQGDLVAYAQGDLDRGRKARIDLHLAACRVCRGELAALERSWEMLDLYGQLEPSPRWSAALNERLRHEAPPGQKPARWWGWEFPFPLRHSLVPALAALVLILVLAGSWLYIHHGPGPIGPAAFTTLPGSEDGSGVASTVADGLSESLAPSYSPAGTASAMFLETGTLSVTGTLSDNGLAGEMIDDMPLASFSTDLVGDSQQVVSGLLQ